MSVQTVIAENGIFIPREILPVGGEWEMMFQGLEIILRPRRPDLDMLAKSIDERRERLQRRFGLFEDSSVLIREDRDRR